MIRPATLLATCLGSGATVAQLTLDQKVEGSNPSSPAISIVALGVVQAEVGRFHYARCMSESSGVSDLIGLLNDESARPDERDDAAIDLGKSDDPVALEALITFARRSDQDDMLIGSCGESIAQIWERQGAIYDPVLVESLAAPAAREVRDEV